MYDQRFGSLAAFQQPRRAVAARCPQAAAFPAGVGIIDATVEPLGVEAHGVGHPQRDHLAVLERDQPVIEVAGRHGDVLAEPERVVLIDPAVIAGFGAVLADALEARAGILIEGPALGAVIAGRLGAIKRSLAFAPVEAAHVAAAERHPDDALAVDIAAPRAEVGFRDVIDFREHGRRRVGTGIDPHHLALAAKHAGGAPDGAVHWVWHHRIESGIDPLVLGRIHLAFHADIAFVAFAVAVGVHHHGAPAL